MDISLVTSDAVDRDNEVMLPSGANWTQFRKNPVVTWAHHYDELPVGRAMWVRRVKEEGQNGWLAKTRYTSAPEDWAGTWFPDAVWHMIKEGDLRGKSVGFIPTEMSSPTEKEIEARPALAGVSMMLRKFTILEYAVAPVQSNPDAYVVAVGKARETGLEIPEVILAEAGLCVPIDIPTLRMVKAATGPQGVEIHPKPGLDYAALAKALDTLDISAIVNDVIARRTGKV